MPLLIGLRTPALKVLYKNIKTQFFLLAFLKCKFNHPVLLFSFSSHVTCNNVLRIILVNETDTISQETLSSSGISHSESVKNTVTT